MISPITNMAKIIHIFIGLQTEECLLTILMYFH
jgi:hypothetical protein